MQPVKNVFGILGALLPIVYCGGLVWYFSGVGGFDGVTATSLGPTILGLGAIGLLFCLPLAYRLLKIFSAGSIATAKAVPAEAESDFDADAALARYMAKRAAGTVTPPPVEPGAGFGRKGL
jgi:hypothetical protein